MKYIFLIFLFSTHFYLCAQNAQYKSWSEISELEWNNLTESFKRTADILNNPSSVTSYQLLDRFTNDAKLQINGATYTRDEFDNLRIIKWKKLEIQSIAKKPNKKDEFKIITTGNNYCFTYKYSDKKLLIKEINDIDSGYKANLLKNQYNVFTSIPGNASSILVEANNSKYEILIQLNPIIACTVLMDELGINPDELNNLKTNYKFQDIDLYFSLLLASIDSTTLNTIKRGNSHNYFKQQIDSLHNSKEYLIELLKTFFKTKNIPYSIGNMNDFFYENPNQLRDLYQKIKTTYNTNKIRLSLSNRTILDISINEVINEIGTIDNNLDPSMKDSILEKIRIDAFDQVVAKISLYDFKNEFAVYSSSDKKEEAFTEKIIAEIPVNVRFPNYPLYTKYIDLIKRNRILSKLIAKNNTAFDSIKPSDIVYYSIKSNLLDQIDSLNENSYFLIELHSVRLANHISDSNPALSKIDTSTTLLNKINTISTLCKTLSIDKSFAFAELAESYRHLDTYKETYSNILRLQNYNSDTLANLLKNDPLMAKSYLSLYQKDLVNYFKLNPNDKVKLSELTNAYAELFNNENQSKLESLFPKYPLQLIPTKQKQPSRLDEILFNTKSSTSQFTYKSTTIKGDSIWQQTYALRTPLVNIPKTPLSTIKIKRGKEILQSVNQISIGLTDSTDIDILEINKELPDSAITEIYISPHNKYFNETDHVKKFSGDSTTVEYAVGIPKNKDTESKNGFNVSYPYAIPNDSTTATTYFLDTKTANFNKWLVKENDKSWHESKRHYFLRKFYDASDLNSFSIPFSSSQLKQNNNGMYKNSLEVGYKTFKTIMPEASTSNYFDADCYIDTLVNPEVKSNLFDFARKTNAEKGYLLTDRGNYTYPDQLSKNKIPSLKSNIYPFNNFKLLTVENIGAGVLLASATALLFHGFDRFYHYKDAATSVAASNDRKQAINSALAGGACVAAAGILIATSKKQFLIASRIDKNLNGQFIFILKY